MYSYGLYGYACAEVVHAVHYILMAYLLMAYIAMVHTVMAKIAMVYTVMAYIGMAYIVTRGLKWFTLSGI